MPISTSDVHHAADRDAASFGRAATRKIAAARLVSVTGSQAAQTALLVDVFAQTGSTTWLSIAAFASVGVLGLASPLAGAIADRYDRRAVMILAELAGALSYLALLLPVGAAATVALMMVGTALNAPVRAASAALVPTLVRPEHLTWANGLLSGSFSTGLLAGPVLGGLLTAAAGPAAVYAVNGMTFVTSAAVLALALPRSGPPVGTLEHRESLWAGVVHLVRQPQLRLLSLGSVLLFLAFGLTAVTDLPLSTSLGVGPVGFGLLAALWGGGSIAGSMACAKWSRPGQEQMVSTGGCLAMAVGLGAVAVLPSFSAILCASAVGGVGSGLVFPPWTTLLQTLTPAALRGRVFAASDAIEQSMNAFGTLTAAPLLTTIGIRPSYLVIGGLAACAAACLHRSAGTTPLLPLSIPTPPKETS